MRKIEAKAYTKLVKFFLSFTLAIDSQQNHVVPALYHYLVEFLRQSRWGRKTVAFVDYSYDLIISIDEQIEQHK